MKRINQISVLPGGEGDVTVIPNRLQYLKQATLFMQDETYITLTRDSICKVELRLLYLWSVQIYLGRSNTMLTNTVCTSTVNTAQFSKTKVDILYYYTG